MEGYALLLHPSANRVYGQTAPRLAAAELGLTAPWARGVAAVQIAGVDYVRFESDKPELGVVARQSAALALFGVVTADCGAAPFESPAQDASLRDSGLLLPVPLPDPYTLPDSLVTIPKYPGKTNERFTQLLLNLAAFQVPQAKTLLDPLAGRGTTLLTAWRCGLDAHGVEADEKAFDSLAGYTKTYLRRGRYKHTADVTPVRRDGRSLGRRFDAVLRLGETEPGKPTLRMTVFTGDTRDSAKLYGKKRFDLVVADAPYGVAHGATTGKDKSRSPERLLREAIPVWAGQLADHGALGLSWNTHTLPRAELLAMLREAGLHPREGGAWDALAHRVDAGVNRDLVVAVKG
jgi:tRNA1(Val) A37 N6-methylase TrmN6